MSFIDDFEALRVAPADFGHARHVELAWCYFQVLPADAARARFATALQRFAAAAGVPGKYDAALTEAWLDRIAARLAASESWADFAARNPDLFDQATVRRGTRSATTPPAPASP